jgi:hypothetical protein
MSGILWSKLVMPAAAHVTIGRLSHAVGWATAPLPPIACAKSEGSRLRSRQLPRNQAKRVRAHRSVGLVYGEGLAARTGLAH